MTDRRQEPCQSLRTLSDKELLARLEALVAQEREGTVDVVEHLMEVDRRESAIDLAYPSLFIYCVKRLGYSEAAAFFRIRAARAAANFPEVTARLRSGRLNLEALVRLYPYLEKDNCSELLDRASGASKREVLSLVAQMEPETGAQRDVIVPIRAAERENPSLANHENAPLIERSGGPIAQAEESEARQGVVPPPRHRFHFTADAEFFLLVERLRGLMRHKIPDGRLELVLKEAVKALIERIERQRLPVACPTRTEPAASAPLKSAMPALKRTAGPGSRFVPRTVRRFVWARDGGRCAYTAPDGRRCESREALEYEHIIPWSVGGRSDTPENIRLLCRVHNQRLGRRRFGPRRRG